MYDLKDPVNCWTVCLTILRGIVHWSSEEFRLFRECRDKFSLHADLTELPPPLLKKETSFHPKPSIINKFLQKILGLTKKTFKTVYSHKDKDIKIDKHA